MFTLEYTWAGSAYKYSLFFFACSELQHNYDFILDLKYVVINRSCSFPFQVDGAVSASLEIAA